MYEDLYIFMGLYYFFNWNLMDRNQNSMNDGMSIIKIRTADFLPDMPQKNYVH